MMKSINYVIGFTLLSVAAIFSYPLFAFCFSFCASFWQLVFTGHKHIEFITILENLGNLH